MPRTHSDTHLQVTKVPLFVCALVAALLVVCTHTPVAHAQAQAQTQETLLNITLEQKPKIAGPNQTVQFRAVSYYFDMDRAVVTWYVDGTQVKSARGAVTHTLVTGPVGSVTTVEVSAVHPNGKRLSKQVTIRPAYVGLTWEAHTYAPPLYKGKRLHSPGSEVTIVALPVLSNGSGTLDPDELTYTWYNSGTIDRDASGFGKRAYTTTNTRYLRPLEVSVDVQNVDTTLSARGEITVPVAQPFVNLYERHPLRGLLLGRTLTTPHKLRTAELTVVAEPYFVSAITRDAQNIAYQWRRGTTDIASQSSITLRPEGEGRGMSDLVLTMKNTTELLQSARQSLQVTYSVSDAAGADPFAL